MTRRFLAPLAFTALASLLPAAQPVVQVYKTKTCGCCGKWVEHMRANGFTVNVTDVPNTQEYRQKYGVPENLMSCHTAVVGKYAIEGHVPAREIHRMLKEKPNAKGMTVPGMPMGSPGMEQGGRVDNYSVLLFDSAGKTTEFAKYPQK
jgi:hypothetical protein